MKITIKKRAKTSTVVAAPVEPVEPVEPVDPVEPVISETPVEPEYAPGAIEPSVGFSYAPYVAGATERPASMLLVSIVCASLFILLFCIFYFWRPVFSGDIAVYTVPMTVTSHITENNRVVVNLSTPQIQDPYVDVYQNNKKLNVDVITINGTTQEVVLPAAGEYIFCAFGHKDDAIYYAISSTNVDASSDFTDLTALIKAYINDMSVQNKDSYLNALCSIYTSACNSNENWEAIHEKVRVDTRRVLGFDDPVEKTEEYVWQGLFGTQGIIDTYIVDNDVALSDVSYKKLLAAIAAGLK